MVLDNFSFGTIRTDGVTREHDVIIDRGVSDILQPYQKQWWLEKIS